MFTTYAGLLAWEDPHDKRVPPQGVAVCKFTVAANRFYKQEEEIQKEVSFFDVTTWTRLAESEEKPAETAEQEKSHRRIAQKYQRLRHSICTAAQPGCSNQAGAISAPASRRPLMESIFLP